MIEIFLYEISGLPDLDPLRRRDAQSPRASSLKRRDIAIGGSIFWVLARSGNLRTNGTVAETDNKWR
jgi:hypothetical protein